LCPSRLVAPPLCCYRPFKAIIAHLIDTLGSLRSLTEWNSGIYTARAASYSTSMRGINQRAVALHLAGIVAAASFFALSCTAQCASVSCLHRLNPTHADNCHHRSNPPWHQHDGQRCPGQSLLLATGAIPSAPDAVPNIQATASLAISPGRISNLVGTSRLAATCSHSPPGEVSGRGICQKESLLRI
jgi:hypothetical protein